MSSEPRDASSHPRPTRTPEATPGPGSGVPETLAPAAPEGARGPAGAEPAIADDVLDVLGAARLLRIGRNTVYELVGRNEIPHRRLGKRIRFSRAAIVQWLDAWSPRIAKEGQ